MINNITNLRVNTVLLEQSQSTSHTVTENTIHISTSLDVSSTKKSIEQYNLRLCVSLTQESSKVLDFLSQRYNEFLSGKAGSIHQDQFNEFLSYTLGDHAQYLSNSHPFSPFSTNNAIKNLVITDGLSQYGHGKSIPEGIMIYDMPLINMISDLKVNKNILNTIKISLPPTDKSLDQISCYAFVYDNKMAQLFSEEPEFNFSLSTGMSPVARGSFRGIHTQYADTFPGKPLVGMINPKQTNNPDSERFRVISTSTDDALAKTYSTIFNGVVALFKTPYLSQSYELNKVIKRSNYFTDFWLSRDLEDNNRFVFSFDMLQFLIDHALFPFVYKSPLFSSALLDGVGDLSPGHLSSVSSVEVMRNKVSSHGSYPVNDLGTIGKGYPSRENLPLPTENIKEVKIDLPSDNESVLPRHARMFFEGCDKFSKPQIIDQQTVESYQYSVNLSVIDHSPMFLRHLVGVLNEQKRILSQIRDMISMSTSTMFGRRPLFDVRTGKTSIDVRTIQINIDNKPVQVGEEITKILTLYQQMLGNMSLDERIDLLSYYDNLFDKDAGLVSMQVFTDIELLLDMGVVFFYNKLVNIFPSDPLGVMDSIAKNNFNKNMSRSVRDNIIQIDHRYRETYSTGKNSNLGVDYIFGEITPMGFSNITVDSYDDRRFMEFNKYFFNAGGGGNVVPGGTYESLSYSYMTPRLIKTPSRPVIDQARVSVSTPQAVEYDFNRYSQLYTDLISIQKQQNLGVTYPTLSQEAQEQSQNNKLYSDIRKMLTEEMGVFLSDDPSAEFSPPKITIDKKRVTTYNPKDKEFCGTNAGPDLVSSIIGGGTNITSSVGLYLDNVNLELKNQNTQLLTGAIEQTVKQEALKERSIKVPFAILGELTVDKRLIQSDRGIKSHYNSMKALPEILKINQNNLEQSMEGTAISALPLQLQSMIIMATTTSPLGVAASAGENVLDARRFILDKSNDSKSKDLVSFFIKGQTSNTNEPVIYGLTHDPMKSYDTFLALWMNYRQIAVVEYLNGFGNIQQPDEQLQQDANVSRLQLAQWSIMSPEVAFNLRNQGGKVLCRVRNLGVNDYLKMVSQFTTPSQRTMLSRYFEEKQLLDMPTYNKYFYISNEVPQSEEVMTNQNNMTEAQSNTGVTSQPTSESFTTSQATSESFTTAQQSESATSMATQQGVTGY